MKSLFAIAFALFSFSASSQNMFWNEYALINPATSGLVNQQDAYVNFSDRFGNYYKKLDALSANYNIRLADKHGLGIHYSGNYSFFTNNSVGVNYNYQFKLGENSKLSAGANVKLSHTKVEESYAAFFEDTLGFNSSTSNVIINLGVAYRWKELLVGATLLNVTTPDYHFATSAPQPTKIGFSAHASYNFQLGEKWTLTPRAAFMANDGFRELTMDLTTTFLNKYSIGLLSTGGDNLAMHVGWDIREKFRISYMQSRYFSKLTNLFNSYAHHFLTLGFVLK